MGCLNQKCDVDLSCLGRRNERCCGEGGSGDVETDWCPHAQKICKLLMLWPLGATILMFSAPTRIANIVEKIRRYS